MTEGREPHIGNRIRSARERLGWSREDLGSRSGVSWGAIAQMESGRRTNTRSDTLLALAQALGVTIEYLVGVGADLPRMFGHQAFSYETDEELLATVSEFVDEGLARSEGVLVALPKEALALVRKGLGPTVNHVEIVDSTHFYDMAPRALSVYRVFVEKQIAAGAPWVRIVAQPPWTGRTPEEERVLMVVESLLDLTFAPLPATVLCPYDRRLVGREVLDEVHRTHPHVRPSPTEVVGNPSYENPIEIALNGPRERD